VNRATYEIIYYLPDVVSGTRWAIGAYVDDGDGRRFVESPTLPTCLSREQRALLESMLSDLEAGKDPLEIGPHLATEGVGEVPSTVEDPVGWVRDLLPGYEEA